MSPETVALKSEIDTFLKFIDLDQAIIRGLEAHAGIQAHLRADGEQPNHDRLQVFRKAYILDRFKTPDPSDPDVQAELGVGLTLEDLVDERKMFQDIALRGAEWIAFAFNHTVPEAKDQLIPSAIEKQREIDAYLDGLNLDKGIRTGLDAIAALKASVYAGGATPTYPVLQDYRAHEILDCMRTAPETDKRRMLDQAAWVKFALDSCA